MLAYNDSRRRKETTIYSMKSYPVAGRPAYIMQDCQLLINSKRKSYACMYTKFIHEH